MDGHNNISGKILMLVIPILIIEFYKTGKKIRAKFCPKKSTSFLKTLTNIVGVFFVEILTSKIIHK